MKVALLDVKFINTSKAFYSYIGTLKISSAKYWKYVQGCAKEKNIEFLYQKMDVGKDTNEDNENDDHDIEDQNVCGDGAESDDDDSDYDDCDVTESEGSVEDLSIVEFNSIEIKERFINFTASFPKMLTASRLICDNIKNANLVPEDLLSNGIVNGDFLKKYHKTIFNAIKNYNCINELYSYDSDVFKVELSNYEKEFINSRIKHGFATMQNLRDDYKKFYNALSSFLTQLELVWKMPSYQQKSPNINERSYTHQVVKCIFDFMFYNIENINIEFDGQSESTKNRNWGHSGPIRPPDVMISKKYEGSDHKWEFGFSEDDWNHGLKYIKSFDVPEAKDIWDEFNHITIHFYKTTMDIYVLDREMKPFHRMVLVKSIEIPLSNNSNFAIEQVCSLCESILFANSLIFENIRKIDSINQLMILIIYIFKIKGPVNNSKQLRWYESKKF
ncbi:unnamed protein product [Rhizophagus irregularis]|nr:unnamed protein product [Rhizophagus irregularis]CAB4446494.1 unnamed protein product [Rhizophagus irregularis]